MSRVDILLPKQPISLRFERGGCMFDGSGEVYEQLSIVINNNMRSSGRRSEGVQKRTYVTLQS